MDFMDDQLPRKVSKLAKRFEKNQESSVQYQDLPSYLPFRPIHPFPARMAPSIAWDSLKACKHKSLKILDPMVGSGTTTVIARALGHVAIGFDTDPLAVLIANTWSQDVDKIKVFTKAKEVLDRSVDLYNKLPLSAAYPRNAKSVTCAFVRYWFDNINRRQLTALAEIIFRLHDPMIKTVLWSAFSRLIITKKLGASLAMDVSHSRPHRVYDKAPIRPFDKFLKSVEFVLNVLPFKVSENSLPVVKVSLGDARQIRLPNRSVDIVITSPPYLNAIDYLRGNKFSLIWMGYALEELREIKSFNIGAEKIMTYDKKNSFIKDSLDEMGGIDNLPARIKGILIRYVFDMNLVLGEISRVLKLRGQAVLVIGDSTIHGVFIQNSKAIISLGKQYGLHLCSLQKRELQENRRYLPPPTSKKAGQQLQNRMREEVILTFKLKL